MIIMLSRFILLLIIGSLYAQQLDHSADQPTQFNQQNKQHKLEKKAQNKAIVQKEKQKSDQEKNKQFILSPVTKDYTASKKQLKDEFKRDVPDPKTAKKKHKKLKKHLKKKPSLKEWLQKRRKRTYTISEMDFYQLLRRKNELILEGEYEIVIKYLEKMLPLSETSEQIIYIMLELGELLMKLENYKKAEQAFIEFTRLYPGNEYTEQAYVKAIECSWLQTAHPERDQTKTEETIILIDEFIERKMIYSEENVDHISAIKKKCLEKLAQNKMSIIKHYIGRGIFRSAHKRLNDLRQEDLKAIPDIEPQLLQLEFELALAEQNDAIKKFKLDELNEKFPEHEITIALNKPKSSWLNWSSWFA